LSEHDDGDNLLDDLEGFDGDVDVGNLLRDPGGRQTQ
jgi:hypothetical protein